MSDTTIQFLVYPMAGLFVGLVTFVEFEVRDWLARRKNK